MQRDELGHLQIGLPLVHERVWERVGAHPSGRKLRSQWGGRLAIQVLVWRRVDRTSSPANVSNHVLSREAQVHCFYSRMVIDDRDVGRETRVVRLRDDVLKRATIKNDCDDGLHLLTLAALPVAEVSACSCS